MLAEMSGKPDDLTNKTHGLRQAKLGQIKPEFLRTLPVNSLAGRAPDLTGEARNDVLTEPHNLADFPYGGPAPEMNDSRTKSSPVAAIFLIDPLDHLFASFMFKIDIDIRRFTAMTGYEALEDHADHVR